MKSFGKVSFTTTKPYWGNQKQPKTKCFGLNSSHLFARGSDSVYKYKNSEVEK